MYAAWMTVDWESKRIATSMVHTMDDRRVIMAMFDIEGGASLRLQ
jgi:hypothetical protein